MSQPTTIGRYQVLRTLGTGAMGVVYEAQDAVLDRKVAIKLIRADLLEGQQREDYLKRFEHEAKAVGRCNHPSVVAVYDFALHEGNPFLALEYIDGVGLDRVLGRGQRFAPSTAVHVVLQLLDALGCAHAAGIVHRDIKPANLLLLEGGRVKVADFGIARLENTDATACGIAVGTPTYMAPEQWRGDGIDGRCDLFSTAILLQEMLIGKRPFSGQGYLEIAASMLNDAPAGGDEIEAVAGPGMRSVIQRALAKTPQERFDSAAAMAEELQRAIGRAASGSQPGEDVDRTVVVMRSPIPHAPLPMTGIVVEQSLLTGIERKLAHHVGPIAHYLMQSSLKQAVTVEQLCNVLAERIDRPEEREQFRTEALETLSSGTTVAATADTYPGPPSGTNPSDPYTPGPITQEEVERARRALAETLGPIAKIFVKRALPRAQTSRELWDLLAANIQSSADRAAFLDQRNSD